MRNLFLMLSAASLAVPVTMAVPATKAEAQSHRYSKHHYSKRNTRHVKRCRRSSGTTGLVAGGVGGAVLGNEVLGHGLLGAAAGGVAGALGGRAVDRTITAKDRCR
jgi:outer membrane lipoprotein SlyB